MSVAVDWVDWDWLAELSTPAARLAAWQAYLETTADHSSPLPAGFDWNESDTDHYLVSEDLDRVVAESDEHTAGLIRRAFPLLGVEVFTHAEDALGFRPLSGVFFASLPPATVQAVVAAARQINLRELAERMDPDQPAAVEAYLRQWVVAFERAAEAGRGVIGFASG
jgi:hypothetical protein